MHVVSAFVDVQFPVLLLVYSIIIGQYLMVLISVRYKQSFAYDNNIGQQNTEFSLSFSELLGLVVHFSVSILSKLLL